MKKISRRNFMRIMGTMAAAGALAACGGSDNTAVSGPVPQDTSEGIHTITFYPSAANVSSGTVGGYKGEYFASRGFNLEVWAYSDEKTNAILASGDLPDVMFIPEASRDIMIQNGMLLKLDDYLEKMPHLMAYPQAPEALNYVRKFKSADTGSVYGIPTSIGDNYNKYKYLDSTERNAVKLRWSTYEKIGAPAINSMDDLLDVMEQMLAAEPTAADGTPNYGTVLNNGSDTSYWACMVMWYRMQGYLDSQLAYLLECNMPEGTYTSILSKDSMYYKGLKWYNEAYKRGLIDPDSVSNDRPTQKVKVDGGYAMIPSGYLPGWAPTYLEYYVPGTKLYYKPGNSYGDSKLMIGINAKTQHLDACLAYLDMLADPDAYLVITSGPEGEFWTTDGNGNAFFTDAAIEHFNSGHGDYTGFTLSNGETLELWNTPFIVWNGAMSSYKDGEGNTRCCCTTVWTEANEISADSENFRSWQKTTGYENWQEWLAEKNAYYSSSPLDNVFNFTSLPDDSMQLTIDAIRDKVTTASWKMVYAASDAEFDSLWEQMLKDCEGLGAQAVIDWRCADIQNAIAIRDSLKA